jgi:hypothetical protein
MESRVRELALFDLGTDSKRRGCDRVSLKVRDIGHGDRVAARAVAMQHKTQRQVQFAITPASRDAAQKWIEQAGPRSNRRLRLLGVRVATRRRGRSSRRVVILAKGTRRRFAGGPQAAG